ncbi:hypothetical protein ACJX0J_026683, partial [Zea mays]
KMVSPSGKKVTGQVETVHQIMNKHLATCANFYHMITVKPKKHEKHTGAIQGRMPMGQEKRNPFVDLLSTCQCQKLKGVYDNNILIPPKAKKKYSIYIILTLKNRIKI